MINLFILLLIIFVFIIFYFVINNIISSDNTTNGYNNNIISYDNTTSNYTINCFDNTTYGSENTIGFIVLRHVNNELTNKYWIYSYHCIRKFYPENFIIIIDDNSDYKYITDEKLYKTKIINSEFPKRGELLPYYYFLFSSFKKSS